MSFFLDYLLGRLRATVHVLDYTHPQGYFTVEQRVPRRIMKEYGSGGELFATINEDVRLKSGRFPAFLPGCLIGDKAYTFMGKPSWDKLAAQYKKKPQNLDEALHQAINAVKDQS